MKCKKCTKEYSDDFSFCPYCGAKKAVEKQVTVPLLYLIPVLSDEQLEMVAAELQGKKGSEIRTIFHNCEYQATVFVIRGEILRDGETKWRLWELMKTTSWLDDKPYSNLRFYVEAKSFTKYMHQYIGRSVFRTMEEAETAILKAGYTRREQSFWYSEV